MARRWMKHGIFDQLKASTKGETEDISIPMYIMTNETFGLPLLLMG
eukprot:CAMPEP_0118639396 /NCGR_PEP_ID=MMETSP0785-20121206/4199_1 /TAXON_ID=91992 /ORGANISM="Bolidomonas pacifica, Strain CCMP 1866" /LENGTH=45 /DNA_ID= /DNA_START= /DNA_END= /DNA_ORIENTATION=